MVKSIQVSKLGAFSTGNFTPKQKNSLGIQTKKLKKINIILEEKNTFIIQVKFFLYVFEYCLYYVHLNKGMPKNWRLPERLLLLGCYSLSNIVSLPMSRSSDSSTKLFFEFFSSSDLTHCKQN